MFNIMPYTEEGTAYDTVSDGDPEVDTPAQRDAARELITKPLTMIGCPSRRAGAERVFPKPVDGAMYAFNASPAESTRGGATAPLAGRGDYAINCGDPRLNEVRTGAGAGPPTLVGARTWDWCVVGTRGGVRNVDCSDPLSGVSFQRSEIGIKHITDGSSKTYLLGEKFIDVLDYETGRDGGDNETWCTGYNNDNFRSTYMPPSVDLPRQEGPVAPEFRSPYSVDGGTVHVGSEIFGSSHPAGLHMSFCDGHVEVIAYDIEPRLHRAYGNRYDGSTSGEIWQ